MLITEEVEVVLGGSNIEYYENLGYKIPRKKDDQGRLRVPKGTKILIKIEDLLKGSRVSIQCLCDYCLEEGRETIINKTYYDYLAIHTNSIIDKDCCKECWSKKVKESNQRKYGVDSTLQIEEVKNKIDKTMIEKYGELNPMKNKEIYEKTKNTRMERYGVEHMLQNREYRQKAINTTKERYGTEYYTQTDSYKENQEKYCLEKYGVKSVFQSDKIKEKSKQTNLKKYGTEHPMQNKIIKNKAMETMYKNGTQKTSKQQRYIYELIINNISKDFED